MSNQPRPKRVFGNLCEIRGRWYVRYSAGGKRYTVPAGTSKGEAEGVLARLTLEHAHERLDGRPHVPPQTFEDFEDRLFGVWKATLRKATLATRRSAYRAYPDIRKRTMRDLTTVEAEAALLGGLASGRALSSVHADRRALSAAWTVAVRMGLARTNVWREVRLPRAEEERHVRLSAREMDALYAQADGALLVALLLMGEAGLRRNEVSTLTWGDVAADKRTVTIRASVAKSRKSRRVPLSARIVAELERMTRGTPAARVVGMTSPRLNVHFRRVADAAGFPSATPHTLRHSFAHRLAEAGVSLYVLRDLLGHSSVAQTEVYAAQAAEDTMRAAVDHADTRRDSRSLSTSDART